MPDTRIKESDLVLPALRVICEHGGVADTSTLISELSDLLKPTGRDAELLSGRADTHFSQKVRNLKSHDTLTAQGFTTYSAEYGFEITNQGREFLLNNEETLSYVIDGGFSWKDTKVGLEKLQQNGAHMLSFPETVSEGGGTRTTVVTRARSKKLRDTAVDYFKADRGALRCEVCCFDFEKKYDWLGEGFIEIHHLKPIYMFDGEDQEKTIDEALANLVPLCANCHRMVHRRRPPYEISDVLAALVL